MAKILIVEDAYLTSQLVYFILNKCNHTFGQAMNGEEAIEKLAEEQFDLVITDLHMPVMDGFSLLEQMRADDRYHDIPVIVMTASGFDWVEVQAYEKGANAFISQPFPADEMRKLVAACLERTSPIRE